jgi:CheY-like chemotaxis protein
MAELAGTALIAVTGYGRDEDRQASLDAGFDRHWVKPLDLAKLSNLLANLHGQVEPPDAKPRGQPRPPSA